MKATPLISSTLASAVVFLLMKFAVMAMASLPRNSLRRNPRENYEMMRTGLIELEVMKQCAQIWTLCHKSKKEKTTKQGSCNCIGTLSMHTVSWQLSSFSSCLDLVHGYPTGTLLLPFIDAAVSSTERGHGTQTYRGFLFQCGCVWVPNTYTGNWQPIQQFLFCSVREAVILTYYLNAAAGHKQAHIHWCTDAHSYMSIKEWRQALDHSCTQMRS